MINRNLLDFEKRRCEKKFVSNLETCELEHIIKNLPQMFSEIFYKRRVNNIYLDSIDLQNYHDNLAGNSFRIKIRIRWYGRIFGEIKKPILELKIKRNDLGWKLSFPLKPFVLDKKFSAAYLQKEVFSQSNLPEWLAEKLKLFTPSLLNSYTRKYFVSADKTHRITLDDNLKVFKIKPTNNLFCEKIEDKYKKVLELKYLYKYHEKTQHITQSLPFRLIANSKYILGIDLLDLW